MSRAAEGPEPKVSVVTVTWNDLAGLSRTVESLRSQTSRDFEHVVVDGGSTDGSLAWLAEHPACTRSHVISEPDDGIYDAMNKGTKAATGELITFLNAGDVYAASDVLTRVVRHHDDHGWDWGHGLARIVDASGQPVRPLGAPTYNWTRHAYGRNDIVHQTVFVRTALLRALGGFDLGYPIAADFHSVLRLGRTSAPGLWPQIDVEFLTGGVSDRRPAQALWDMHLARSAVRGHGRLGTAVDVGWWAVLVANVRARNLAKLVARRAGGDRAMAWWATSRDSLSQGR